MRIIFPKYTSKFIFSLLSSVIILSCIPKHKFDREKNRLSDKKMAVVMADVFLMESYVNEKMAGSNIDSIAAIKLSFYKKILEHHQVDSISFYSTFNYLQAHPKEFSLVLQQVDSNLIKIKPGDTTTIVKTDIPVPKSIENLPNFNEQEKLMQNEYRKSLLIRKMDSIKKKF